MKIFITFNFYQQNLECKLNLHKNRPIHEKGHYKYNLFIKDYLDYLYESKNYSSNDLISFNKFLRKNMRDINIPWN